MKSLSLLPASSGLRGIASAVSAFLFWTLALFVTITTFASAQAQVNAAQFEAQNIPAVMTAGQTYTIGITMRNVGTTTWTPADGYKLGAQNPQDNKIWSPTGRIELTTPVAPGQSYTFILTVTAPSTPGNYNFQWRMIREFVEWFGPASPNASVSVVAPVNAASFLMQNVPSVMTAGKSYNVSVKMTNTGTTTWTPADGYKLGAQGPQDNKIWSPTGRIELTAPVAPGQSYTFTFTVTAPTTTGTYNFQWRMIREFVEWFGDNTGPNPITVEAPYNAAEFVSQSVPAVMTAGKSYNVSVTMRNTGTATWTAANGYRLGAQNPQDNKMWSPTGRIELTAPVAPGQTHTFSFTITAPVTPGTYPFQWKMLQESAGWFGPASPNIGLIVPNPPGVPTLSVSRTPSPLAAGKSFTLSWSTTEATSVAYNCTANGTGFTGSATLAANGSSTGTASAAWVGYPSTCVWTATGQNGSKTLTETMTTVAAPAGPGETITYYHNDASGTPLVATDANGNVVWKENYRPYGGKQNNQGNSNNKLWFTGKPYDDNTGLSYMGARYYDPVVGRFMGIDPDEPSILAVKSNGQDFASVHHLHTLNRYTYANNNPYKFVDPDGRSPLLLIPLIIGLAANELATSDVPMLGGGIFGSGLKAAEKAAAQAGISAVEKGVPLLNGPIKITEKGMSHVVERHSVNGLTKFAGKSKFNEGENLSTLINSGTQQRLIEQANGNFSRTWNAGRSIGVDRVTGQETSIITVITRPNGELVTAFPGRP